MVVNYKHTSLLNKVNKNVMKFAFTFDNMQTSNIFSTFDIREIF